MTGQYRLTQQAIVDLEGIASYIGERNPSAAIRVLDVLYATFEMLGENPDVGDERDDLDPGLRIFSPRRPAHNYVIAFSQLRSGVEINAIIHASRDWPGLLTRHER